MTQEEYLQQRVDDQIAWFDKTSQKNQRWFNVCRIIEITSAALIPFITGMWADKVAGQVVIGILGVLIAICAGLISLKKYQENWINYRATCEVLKKEKYLFISKCNESEHAFCDFVTRIENILAKENSQWLSKNISKGKEQKQN
ncbi:MAG: DUF4231 domain-containing protein [Pseudomonadota bacterium]|nr:DUF4231 domain-containing protein [Pseudomonadota bacterium]